MLVPFDTPNMRRKELAIFNVRRSNHESGAALALLLEQPGWFAPLVTHMRPLERIAEAFSIVENYADGVGKLVVGQPARARFSWCAQSSQNGQICVRLVARILVAVSMNQCSKFL